LPLSSAKITIKFKVQNLFTNKKTEKEKFAKKNLVEWLQYTTFARAKRIKRCFIEA
jgi:hypothetical protein